MRRCTEPPRRGPPPAPPHALRGSARSPGARPQKQFPYSVETTVYATHHRLRLHHPSGQQLAAIYPVASSDLPGPSPTRQSAGTSRRVAGIVRRLAGPGTRFSPRSRTAIAASRNALPASTVVSGSPAAPWPCPAGTLPTTAPTADQGWLPRRPPRAVAGAAS